MNTLLSLLFIWRVVLAKVLCFLSRVGCPGNESPTFSIFYILEDFTEPENLTNHQVLVLFA